MLVERKYKVLVVDDDQAILDVFTDGLNLYGLEAIGVSNGYKALEYLENNKVDVILIDIMMEGLDGITVLEMIKADKDKYGNSPVIVFSNLVGNHYIEQCYELGAVAYIFKADNSMEDIVKEVKKWAEKDRGE